MATVTTSRVESPTRAAGGDAVSPRDRPPSILVTDCGRGSAIAIIRSLRRRGWNVLAGDACPRNVRLGTRSARRRFVYPSPKESPRDFVDCILSVVQEGAVDLIIPVTDEALLPLSQARERIPPTCRLAVAEPGSLELTTDKMKTVELARRLDVPVPRTAIVGTADEALREAETFSWPIVLKPLVSRLFRDGHAIQTLTVSYANDPESLASQMRALEGATRVLLQEYVQGVGHGVELLMHEGRPLMAFQHKRLREVPITGGASSLREGVPLDPLLYDYSLRLLSALRWTGLAMVEFKVGPAGPRLMEINGRVWGSLPLAVHSGVDFPGHLAELFLAGPPAADQPPATEYRVGVRGRNLELDVTWILSVLMGRRRFRFLPTPSRWSALGAIVGLLNPRTRFDILSLSDPAPGIAELLRIAAKLVNKSRDSKPSLPAVNR